MTDKWQEDSFLIGIPGGTDKVSGFTYAGLGLHEHALDQWTLTHLNSGHAAARAIGSLDEVLPGATALAEAVDWTFRGITEWEKQPHFMARLLSVVDGVWNLYGNADPARRDSKIASQIASARGV